MLPNFLIIGAARSGTTSLYNNLLSHPDIYLPKSKRPEPHFFFREAAYANGLDWYESTYFSEWAGEAAVGEASTSYLFGEQTPERISESLPQCRFLVMLRDPVYRAYSNYWHSVKSGLETLDFEEALRTEAERTAALAGSDMVETKPYSYMGRSLYAQQLRRWFELFGADRFCILLFEDYLEDAGGCLEVVSSFLDVSRDGFVTPDRFEENKSTPDDARLPEAVERRLREQLRAEVLDLEALIGRDLSAWL